jgi:hypothetical protein
MSAPTLHEIAAMPLSIGLKAIREHYDPHWGKEIPKGKGKFRVTFDWAVEGHFDDEVEAESEEEAKCMAEEMVKDDIWTADLDLDRVKITLVQEPAQ